MKASGSFATAQRVGRPLKLLVFGYDAAEAAQIRRIRSYLDCGYDVTGFMMRRTNMNRDFVPFWHNVHLQDSGNESPLKRVTAIARSIVRVRQHRADLAGANVIVARNLDMLVIAAAAQRMIGPRPKLIYECLDIHNLMTDPGPKGWLVRSAEHRLLKRCAALIVSSPAFVREYFAPVHAWQGPVTVVENKLWIDGDSPARPTPETVGDEVGAGSERPLVLGWVGTLRCATSLALLAETADQLGPKITLALHGVVHHHAVPEFDEVVSARANMIWHGPYDYPRDLSGIYRSCDLVWSQDLWQWGTNSNWLLPNRIYEASYFGCPSIAVAGTETGRRVEAGLGWTIAEPQAAALADLLDGLSVREVTEQRRALLQRPESEFLQSSAEIATAIEAATDSRC